MSQDLIIGIDLGTTFSAIAYINSYGKPEIIPNREGDRTTPSIIFFERDGTPVVGKEARNLAMTDPSRVISFLKREMGNPSFRFNVDGRDYFPEDLSAIILKKLKRDAEEYLGQEIKKVVISVPAYFKDAQRECTRQAGEIAGLEVLRIINEPTAAALAYGLDRGDSEQTVLVYDFGGGTFDVTLMRLQQNHFKILATDGDARLGGKDIDEAIVGYLAQEFLDTYGVDLRQDRRSRQDLWDKAEIAKRDLSFRSYLAITLSHQQQALRVDLDRKIFGELIADIIEKTEEYMHKVVDAAGLTWAEIDTVLLAGGSSRIPVVQEMIKRVTGKEAARNLNPDECVAMGAALQALVTAVEEKDDTLITEEMLQTAGEITVTDIATHSLGVKALASDKTDFVNSLIIPRYTPLPVERTRCYTTNQDNQQKVEIEVLQGEDEDPNSPNVDLIGRVSLDDLPPHHAGELVIEVTLKYDLNGVIEVIAKELNSGQLTREIVMQKPGSLSEEILAERKRLLELIQP